VEAQTVRIRTACLGTAVKPRWYLAGVVSILVLATVAVTASSATVSSWAIISGLLLLAMLVFALASQTD
jgi:hypothetical protein